LLDTVLAGAEVAITEKEASIPCHAAFIPDDRLSDVASAISANFLKAQ